MSSILQLKTPRRKPIYIFGFLSLCSLLLVPLGFAGSETPSLTVALGLVLIILSIFPMIRFISQGNPYVPVFPLLCLAYGAQFGLPVLMRRPELDAFGETLLIEMGNINAALVLSIFGLIFLQAGFYWSQGRRISNLVPTYQLNLDEKKAFIFCLVVGIAAPFLPQFSQYVFGENAIQFSAVIGLLQKQVYVCIGILVWLTYKKEARWFYKPLLYAIVAVAVLKGTGTAMLEDVLVPILVLIIALWNFTKRIPWKQCAILLVVLLFLSPAKHIVRAQLWNNSAEVAEMTAWQRTEVWVTEAATFWQETALGERDPNDSLDSTTSRLDFLSLFGHVYDLTPATIPYREGETLYNFAFAIIPRAIWPDKPVFGDASRKFAIEYGLTTEEGADRTAFGIGLPTEGYLNFGPVGTALICLAVGLFIGILLKMFGSAQAGPGCHAIFIGFTVYLFNGLGGNSEIIYGNVLQSLMAGYFLLSVLCKKKHEKRALNHGLRA